jgi:hypothetical protein
MRSFDELESQYLADYPTGRSRGTVELICIRPSPGVHETPGEVEVSAAGGVAGDRWDTSPKRDVASQVTLMNRWVAEWVGAGAQPLHMSGDNFFVDVDLAEAGLPPGARVRIGGVLLEVTDKLHAGCKKFAERFGQEALRWVNWHEHRMRRLRGVNCRVLEDGIVRQGDVVDILPSV